MEDNFAYVILAGIIGILAAIGLTLYVVVTSDLRKYRKLVPTSRVLLDPHVRFMLTEYSTKEIMRVQVLGVTFEDFFVQRAVINDILDLETRGHSFSKEYFSDVGTLLPREMIEPKLIHYWMMAALWQNENQGRPTKKTKPTPPYHHSVVYVAK